MAYANKEDQIAASRKHYLANKNYYRERNQKYRRQLSSYVNNIKETTPCADCGLNYPYYVMDFDHINSSNKKGLVSFYTKTGRISAMKEEIEKCEVVCSNCHRARTYNRLHKK